MNDVIQKMLKFDIFFKNINNNAHYILLIEFNLCIVKLAINNWTNIVLLLLFFTIKKVLRNGFGHGSSWVDLQKKGLGHKLT